jgi:hypothetical protein
MKNTNNSVKKHQTYLVLLFALLLSGTMNAKVDNYMGGYLQGGEWTLLPQGSKYGPSYGAAGGLGFLYELQAGKTYSSTRFLFDIGVGAQGGLTSFMQSSNMTATLKNQTDLDGAQFDYVYEISDRHDQYVNVAVQVPLMIGVQHKRFYMLIGAKAGYNIFTKTRSTAVLSTFGQYAEFDEFRDMPEYQFFTNRPISGGVKTNWRLDVAASLEMGGRLGLVTYGTGYDVPKRKVELRLAGFVDYGIFDIHSHGSNEALGTRNPDNPNQILPLENNLNYNSGATAPVYNTESMVNNLVMSDIMSTTNFASSVNNLVIGLKFTVLFQLPEEGKCVLCQDAYRSAAPSSARGKGVKYEE